MYSLCRQHLRVRHDAPKASVPSNSMTSMVCRPARISLKTFGACLRSSGVPAKLRTWRLTWTVLAARLTHAWAFQTYRIQTHESKCEAGKDASEEDKADDEGDIPPEQWRTRSHVHMRLAVDVLVFGRQT